MAMSSRHVDIQIRGEGPDLVLLHSLLSDRTSFDRLAGLISSKRRVILVNLPGFGASAPAEPIVGYAERMLSLFSDISLPSGTDLLGNGLGSFVALQMAADPGARLGRLVLLGAAIVFPNAARQTFRALADRVEHAGMASVADAAMVRMFPDDFIAANPSVIAERKMVFMQMDRATFAAAARALAALDLGRLLDHVRNPVQVIAGEKDGATPPALGRALADALPNAQFVELPGVGHAPHIQAPDEVVKAISPFLGLS
jgi:3-oxoadipate enol-lactonase